MRSYKKEVRWRVDKTNCLDQCDYCGSYSDKCFDLEHPEPKPTGYHDYDKVNTRIHTICRDCYVDFLKAMIWEDEKTKDLLDRRILEDDDRA